MSSLEGNVTDAQARQSKAGKTFFTAKITDGAFTANVTSFSHTFEHVNGRRAKWGGMGIKRGDDYNGQAQFTLGDKVLWDKDAGPVTPAGATPAKAAQKEVDKGIEGVTVGMALNKAVDIAVFSGDTTEDAIWRHASMLIRLSTRLKAGDVAKQESNS